ncbi:hypothetical protein Tco_0195590 [Tanacetum coccineum]
MESMGNFLGDSGGVIIGEFGGAPTVNWTGGGMVDTGGDAVLGLIKMDRKHFCGSFSLFYFLRIRGEKSCQRDRDGASHML